MYYENKLTINFTSNKAAKAAKEVIAKALTAKDYDDAYADRPSERLIKDLELSKNVLSLDGSKGYYVPEDMLTIAKNFITEIAKAITEEFSVDMWNYSDYSESSIEAEFNGSGLEIKSTYYPMGYVEEISCPICGDFFLKLEDYDETKTYVCPECGETIDSKELKEVFDQVNPVIEKELINIR